MKSEDVPAGRKDEIDGVIDIDELMRRPSFQLTEPEVAEIVHLLRTESGDAASLIILLGRAGRKEYRSAVEPYLDCEIWPYVAAWALRALCLWWDLADEYKDRLIDFLRGVEWDEGNTVKVQAINIAGEYLRNHSDHAMLEILSRTFSNPTECPIVRSAAYCALGRAVGAEWRNLPPASRVMDFEAEVDPTMLARVKERLS